MTTIKQSQDQVVQSSVTSIVTFDTFSTPTSLNIISLQNNMFRNNSGKSMKIKISYSIQVPKIINGTCEVMIISEGVKYARNVSTGSEILTGNTVVSLGPNGIFYVIYTQDSGIPITFPSVNNLLNVVPVL